MASNKQLDVDGLVYSYLLKKSPKCAKNFSKEHKIKAPPPDSPALEEIINVWSSNTKVQKTPAKGTPVNKKTDQDSSSDSSSESENDKLLPKSAQSISQQANAAIRNSKRSNIGSESSQEVTKPKAALAAKSLTKPTISKEESSSSSDSDSDTLLKNKIQSNQASVKIGKEEDSSDSSDSEDESNAKNTSTLLTKGAPSAKQAKLFAKSPKKKEISDSSSDSEDETPNASGKTKNTPPNLKTPLQKSKKDSSSSTDDSDTDSGKVKTIANKIMPSKQNAKVTSEVSKNVLPAKQLQNKILKGKKGGNSSSSSSSSDEAESSKKTTPGKSNNWMPAIKQLAAADSSSDSESEDENVMVSLTKKHSTVSNVTATKKGKTVASKLGAANKKDSSDDSSSESEDEQPMNTNQVKGLKQINATSNSVNKTVASNSSKVTAFSNNQKSATAATIALNKVKESDSSSDSSSDEEGEKLKSKSQTLTSKKSIPSTKPTHGVSSSSDDSENEDHPSLVQGGKQGKIAATQAKETLKPTKTNIQSAKKKDSSDSSSDSEEEKGIKPSLLSKAITPISKKKDSSSSESSSEDEASKVPKVKSVGKDNKAKQVNVQAKTVKKDTFSSDSDSDEVNKPTNNNSKSKTPAKTTPVPALTKKTPDTSSDSSSEDDSKALLNKSIAQNVGVVKKGIVTSSKNVSKKSSSDTSSNEDNPVQKTTIVKSFNKNMPSSNVKQDVKSAKNSSSAFKSPGVKQSVKDSESSDESSSEDENVKQPVKMKQVGNVASVPNLNKNSLVAKPSHGKSSSSDSSSDEEEAKRIKSILPKQDFGNFKSKVAPPKRKSDSSSDSSDEKNAPPSKKLGLPQHSKGMLGTPGKKIPLKQKESSSDSSSEEENTSAKLKNSNLQNSVKRKRSSSSSSASEDESQPSKKSNVSSQVAPSQVNQSIVKIPVTSDSTTTRHRGSSPFRRVKTEQVTIDYRRQQASQIAKHAIPGMASARGKQFRHEKTKKKKGTHAFGKIDTTIRSIPFDD